MGKTKEEEGEEFESFVDEEPIAAVSINKYDQNQLREGINDTLTALLEEQGFQEDHQIINCKIVLGLISVAIAAYS